MLETEIKNKIKSLSPKDRQIFDLLALDIFEDVRADQYEKFLELGLLDQCDEEYLFMPKYVHQLWCQICFEELVLKNGQPIRYSQTDRQRTN